MATVYLARDEQHFRQVALKAFRLESDAGDGADRFLQEIKVVARLAHPNILPLHDSGQIDGFLYYVMPFVPGESLRQRLEREGALPIADALAIAGQVASALAYAHSHDVIHRDIKPDNILFLAGQAVVADFGIARAISAGGWKRKDLLEERVGTPAYMSPEQASGGSRAVDHRSDLYSLGCVLYEMLTGEPPFRGTTPEDLVVQHLEAEPAPVETRRATVPPELRRLVGRALSKNPADRYATAHQFAEAIARVQQGEAAAATPAEPLPVRRAAIPWRWLLPAAAIAAVVYAAFVTAATRRGLGAGATDPGHLAVAPFVHHEGAAPLLLTGEQCARLLREALTRWDDVSVVDSRWFDDRIARLPAPAELDELLRLAREARAGRLLSGEVWPFRDSVRIRGVLYETGRGARVLRERTVTVSASLEDLEARFTELADSLLLPRPQAAAAAGGVLGTRLIAAWQAYDSAHAALARWDLPAAATGFTEALDRDPGYGLAHLWLAQTQNWLGRSPDTWRDHALAGLGARPALPPPEREWALALAALAEQHYPEACDRYEAMIRRDSLDFRGWYGRAECRARDPIVVADPQSPSGWRFRSSYQAAINDYHHAMLLVPSAHQAFRGAAFARLTRVYYAETNIYRRGSRADPAASEFAAFPVLSGDTLAFVPWPQDQIGSGATAARGGAAVDAIVRNRRRLTQLTGEWVRAFPGSVPALEASALALELSGEFGATGGAGDSAVLRIRDAARRATDHGDRVRLASTALRLLVKRERFTEAAALADSLLTATPDPTTEEAPYLAAAAALTGRASLAAALARRAAPDEVIWSPEGAVLPVPLPLRETALALEAFAAVGAPADSLDALLQVALRQLSGYLAGARREAADAALLDRTRVLLFPDDRSRPTPRTRKSVDYLVLLHEAVRSHRPAEARAMMARVAEQRRDRPFGRVAVEGAIAEALAELGMGDTTAAVARLDGYLDGLGGAGIDLTERTVAAGSLVRLLALRARLADAQGDRPMARRRAGDVLALWGRADPGLAPVLAEMRALRARPS